VDWESEILEKTANTVRFLSADAVERAASGHPGMPMGAADYAVVLWAGHLVVNPDDTVWPNRDRFILSAGHGSMLLYSLLHLFGYDLSIEDIKNFRQWGSKTPGHPEYGMTPGVETTTGPLGQGFANGVGMALASRLVAERINTEEHPVISHRVFGMVSDGDIMEGVASEAASLAGHLGLGNIIYIYDDNDITIEGSRALSYSEDTARRFEAYGWQVLSVSGHDRTAINSAISLACAETERPSIIMARTKIAFGCPTKEGKAETHGAPLGPEEISAAKERVSWDGPEFHVPEEVYDFCRAALEVKLGAYQCWREMLDSFREKEPERAKLFDAFVSGELPADLAEKALAAVDNKPMATRKASGAVLQILAEELPFMFGGSADLGPSNNTLIKGSAAITRNDFSGRNIHFGIREHGMGSVMNGMALYGMIPYAGTFLVFSDYMRPALRLSALMGLRVIWVFTHDSIFVGEDGPTHQPVEHLAALRSIPGLHVVRPADSAETAVAWCEALKRDGPTALILSRQTLPAIDRDRFAPAEGLARGGYILAGPPAASSGARAGDDDPELLIMATGSEVSLGLEVYEELAGRGLKVRLASMPCLERFEEQDKEYRDSVIPPGCKRRVVIEAGVSLGWHKYAGQDALAITMESFGSSAPHKVLAEKLGFNREAVLEMIDCTWPDLEKD